MGRSRGGTPLIRTPPPVGTYSSPMPRDLCGPRRVGVSYERGAPVAAEWMPQIVVRKALLLSLTVIASPTGVPRS
jgi:hypothetical protein